MAEKKKTQIEVISAVDLAKRYMGSNPNIADGPISTSDQQKQNIVTGQVYDDCQGQDSPRRPTTISDIAVEQIGDQYILHYKCDDPRVINRDDIVKPISKQEFDNFLAADDEGRFQLYNKICKVKEGASTYGGSTVPILKESTPEEQAAVLKTIRSVNWDQPTKEDIMNQLSPEQQEVAQHMMDKMENWLKDNPMLLYGEKDGKPFIYDMTDREYDKYMVLNNEQKEKYIQKLFTSKEAAAALANENKEAAAVQADANLNQDGATVDTGKKGQMQAASGSQKFGLLELLKALLQAFGFIPPEQERKAEVMNDVVETQQNRQDQQEQKQQSTTVDRSIAAQAKALSEANTEALVADQQQSQQVNRGMHI